MLVEILVPDVDDVGVVWKRSSTAVVSSSKKLDAPSTYQQDSGAP